MQPIRDKDFDQLFKNTFEDAEITPSRDLWSSIESEIEPKKKRIIPIYWLAAAAVLLIATVGILIYQQQNITDSGRRLANKAIDKVNPAEQPDSAAISAPQPVEKAMPILPAATKPVNALVKNKVKEDVKPLENHKIVTAPEMQKQETIIAMVEEPKQDIKSKIEAAILQPKQETVIAMVETSKAEVENDTDQNKGIRNVGDVVNLIVNKVDKRKDKFIQFRTDDDDSSISSINIGPFKFGKRNKK
ncbi:hypothetical protein DU508_10745 [Pedobacter chinensis]|uniref:Uncharacterized protein n=1 Tax=Pedobacter chinensis TaxID=2282421 RepID=A0A369PY03_9SPHI|nr:hypothetical protein [Pedobacter chinensis]RDC56095.1 hypothetical protein DU508_10745 [Pedobacter chinensis]